MAFPTSVNDQITDSVTQTNVKILGESPAEAMGNIYQNESESVASSSENTAFDEQQSDLDHLEQDEISSSDSDEEKTQ